MLCSIPGQLRGGDGIALAGGWYEEGQGAGRRRVAVGRDRVKRHAAYIQVRLVVRPLAQARRGRRGGGEKEGWREGGVARRGGGEKE